MSAKAQTRQVPQPVTSRRGGWRLARRVAAGLAAVVILGAAIVGFGWRYGFRSLPQPVPGGELALRADRLPSAPGTSNFWYWCRAASAHIDRSDATTGTLRDLLEEPWGLEAPTGEQWRWDRPADWSGGLERWLARHRPLEDCLQGALRSIDLRRPQPVAGEEIVGFNALAHYCLVRAAGSADRGATTEAIRHVLAGWRLQALVARSGRFQDVFDERGLAHVDNWVGRPWRGLVLAAPAIPFEQAQALIAELDGVSASLPEVEHLYAQEVAHHLESVSAGAHLRWKMVRAGFAVALREGMGEVRSWLGWAVGGFGGPGPRRREAAGTGRWAAPMRGLLEALEEAAARPRDIERMQAAFLSHTAARLRKGEAWTSTEEQAWRDRWSGPANGWRFLDRPAIWRSVASWPRAGDLQMDLRWWRLWLESCRLTMALRAFKDRHGDWPERLEDLRPELLTTSRVNRTGDALLRYERTSQGWRLWRDVGATPGLDQAGHAPQGVFGSDEVWPATRR